MPTVTVDCAALLDFVGIEYTADKGEDGFVEADLKFGVLCFNFGIENDGLAKLDNKRAYKIDIPANRYDLLCLEGLSRALRVFLGKELSPVFQLSEAREQVLVHPSTRAIRPFVTCAILRNVNLTPESYASFLDLQDHLHRNLCRQRTLVAIGTHDMDSPIKFPVRYEALSPDSVQFRHLFNQTGREQTGKEVLDEFRTDPERSHLKEYTNIIYDSPVYPVILDANNQVLSLPPIINGYHSRMSASTKNIFIECTATDLTKANIVLDTMVTMFSRYCANAPDTIEKVEVVYLGGIPDTVAAKLQQQKVATDSNDVSVFTPVLTEKRCAVSVAEVNSYLGLELPGPEIARLLSKMQLAATCDDDDQQVQVTVPPTRADILHAVDLIEDVAIAYGFNDVPERFPVSHVPGRELPINLLTDLLRVELAGAGYTEILTFGLCGRDSNFKNFGNPDDDANSSAVSLANSATPEYNIARTCLVPGLLKTLQEHHDAKISDGLKLFEVSDVVLLDPTADTGARNVRRLAALYTGPSAGFEHVHGVLDRVMELLNVIPDVTYSKDGFEKVQKRRENHRNATQAGSYALFSFKGKSKQSGAGPNTYFRDLCAMIGWKKPNSLEFVEIGTMGIIHPSVLKAFDVKTPVSVLEITLDDFVEWA